MTTGKKASTGKGKVKKLNIKKDTIRALDAKGKAAKVKGGRGMQMTWGGCGGSEGLCNQPGSCRTPGKG